MKKRFSTNSAKSSRKRLNSIEKTVNLFRGQPRGATLRLKCRTLRDHPHSQSNFKLLPQKRQHVKRVTACNEHRRFHFGQTEQTKSDVYRGAYPVPIRLSSG